MIGGLDVSNQLTYLVEGAHSAWASDKLFCEHFVCLGFLTPKLIEKIGH